ncbi:MAG: hypothetical protein H6654_05845 [Ardenticatenaceae bacterium]|nr:hypothetical protein [Ardenticatenaceae bacterium]
MAVTPPDEMMFGRRTKITRGMKMTATLFFLLLAALITIVVFPITTTTPAWVEPLQTNVYGFLARISPYILVGLLGSTVAIAELVSTFQTYPREALRTRFVLAKRIGDDGQEGEVALNLGWLYDQFQNLARTQIDLELMNNRRTAVTRLLNYYPSMAELYDIAWYTITSRATLTREQEDQRKTDLEKLLDPKAPENFAKSSIALMILENGGQAYVELLLTQAMQNLSPEAVAMGKPSTTEKLIWELVDNYSLPEMVALAEKLSTTEKAVNYVREAAQPDPEANAANQKATIAHFLVQQIGVEPLQKAMKEQELEQE